MITAYYNEFDPKAAAWIRQLIKNGNITPGVVDERSITEVSADDLVGFDRCHFFSGIGTWDYCLNESGWGDKPIWTASLPCQPFSAAGKGLGKADERHLLPHFLELVKECRPTTIIGEQVAASIGHGWLDDLYTEMEACDYAIGSAVIGAHSVNSPHIRQRLYWLADSTFATRIRPEQGSNCESHGGEFVSGMADSDIKGSQGREGIECSDKFSVGKNSMVGGLADTKNSGRNQGAENGSGDSERVGEKGKTGRFAEHGGMGISDSAGSQPGIETSEAARYGHTFKSTGGFEWMVNARYMPIDRMADTEHEQHKRSLSGHRKEFSQNGERSTSEFTGSSEIDWIFCRDNKYRPIKPGIFPLASRITGELVHSGDRSAPIDANNTQEARVMRLKGYGNAIQAQTAIAFIRACMSAT